MLACVLGASCLLPWMPLNCAWVSAAAAHTTLQPQRLHASCRTAAHLTSPAHPGSQPSRCSFLQAPSCIPRSRCSSATTAPAWVLPCWLLLRLGEFRIIVWQAAESGVFGVNCPGGGICASFGLGLQEVGVLVQALLA